jgi:hypothetical protein
MSVSLPPAIENYFVGKNARDFAKAVSGFAPSAVVKDEGQDHRGPDAIRAWIETTTAKYDNTADVKSVVEKDGKVEVAAEVSGTFPGSPILLRFKFTLDGDQISSLSIAP